MEFMARVHFVDPPEAGLKAFCQRDDGRGGVSGEIPAGGVVERQRPQGDVLAADRAELREVVVDGVHQLDGHRIVDDRVGSARLIGASTQGQKRRLGHPG
jgi:hypothetical protein